MSARAMRHDDLAQVVRLHLEAFAGTMGASLGPGYARSFLRWFIDAPEAEAMVVERDGAVAGYVVGAVHGYATRMNRALLPAIALGVARHPHVLVHRNFVAQLPARLVTLASRRLGTREAESFGIPGGPSSFALVGIGVSGQARRSGVGVELLRSFEARVFSRAEVRTLFLDVYADNQRARHAYEQAGWTLARESGRVVVYVRARPEQV